MVNFLCLIDTDDRNYYFQKALKRLAAEAPGDFSGACFSPMEVRMRPEQRERLMELAHTCDFAVVYFHGGCQNLPDFSSFWQAVSAHAPCFFVSSLPEEIAELAPQSGVNAARYAALNDYFSRPTEENVYNMLLRAANEFFGAGPAAAPYAELPSSGIYQPGSMPGAAEEAEYLERARASGKPVVGVIVHRSYVASGNTKAVDALLEALRGLGAFPLPVFSSLSQDGKDASSGIRSALDRFFRPGGRRLVDAVIVTTGFSLTYVGCAGEAGSAFCSSVLERYDVPALQAMVTRYSPEQYDAAPQGIDSMSLASNVFQPEMDGQIITVPYAASAPGACDGLERRMWEPLGDRIERIARRALNYAKLSHKKNADKRIAILFHNMPGNHNIGRGAGLDTFASVYGLLNALKAEGYAIDEQYASPQAIADRLIGGLTNDTRWISSEEAVRRAAGKVDLARMREWFAALPGKALAQLEEQWGAFPGAVMVEREKLLIPGMLNGNVFIGLQPSRAFDAQAEALYHSAVFSPPYSYIAYYRWIEEVFQADAVIHVGTHGSLEWLPGKEVGLSRACYPDICIGNLPHYYIYHMGITGEGIQAKRRSGAVILDHLPPSMDDSGAYGKLEDINGALREYAEAKRMKSAQVGVLRERICGLAKEADLLTDMRLTEVDFRNDPDGCIDKLHLWVEELKNSAVTDGLHVFGEAPEGELLENMLRMLARVKNGDVLSLNDAVLAARGYDPEAIKDDPSGWVDGQAVSAIYASAVEAARALIAALHAAGFDPACVERIVAAQGFVGDRAPLKRTLTFLCAEAYPRLMRTADEMKNLLSGLSGRFVEPGLGGNPTRGNAMLLPTGRNFYAGDPSEIPSRGAWEIGRKLAEKSLAHYLNERGEYPESVAMVVWSGNVIKTSGEDFGEAFYLMGVRPVYLGQSSKVIGVEAIPLQELGRPRIDVTLRISGLFRDMYPNLIELMDAAVACAAAEDEPEDKNYIRKHINEDMLAFLKDGVAEDEALDRAGLRVFGCPAGGYGAGVANLIANRNWSDYTDIARVYETWSGNAYGKNHHGTAAPELFKRRLSTVGMTIKNESTVEIDMLSSDDFFSYHGGLAACVKANAGSAPISITGHSDDPERPQVRDAARETARIMRSRILNPKWLTGLKRHGFKGAQEIAKAMESFFGWDASAEVAEDWMYEGVAERFLFDEETRQWIEEVNPGVLHDVSGKLIEASRRGMWNAKEDTLRRLEAIHLKTEGILEEGER